MKDKLLFKQVLNILSEVEIKIIASPLKSIQHICSMMG